MDPRAQALERLQAKRRFQRHALIYAVVIGLLGGLIGAALESTPELVRAGATAGLKFLPAADRVIELRGGRIVADEPPRTWLARTRATPVAKLFALAGLPGAPARVAAHA